MLPTNDKSIIVKEIEQLIDKDQNPAVVGTEHSVIIFDGMAVANKINIKKYKDIKTCSDYAIAFLYRIKSEAAGFDEILIIFDRYIENSLKSKTRDSRTSGVQVQYKIADDTRIEHISTSQFLSHIQTKNELTAYLSEKLSHTFSNENKKYVVVYDTKCNTNLVDFDNELMHHTHEEADVVTCS